MKNISLPDVRSIIESKTDFDTTLSGLVIICGRDTGWIDSVISCFIRVMASRKIETLPLMTDLQEIEYYRTRVLSFNTQAKMNFYGNLSRVENLEKALKSAKSSLSLGYFNLGNSSHVFSRITDVLGSENFDKNLVKYVFSCES